MHKFVRNLITEWRKLDLPFADAKILVAVSGGADSVSLLLALSKLRELKKLRTEIVVAHFNHQLRGEESENDEQFVEELAENLDFRFICGKPEIKIQNQKGNLEQLARNYRYKFLSETAIELGAFCVLTAHTLNDQAETFLFNLLRGSGIDGLSAMKAKRSLEPGVWSLKPEEESKSEIRNLKSEIDLVRPLLNWAKREETEMFCRENGVEFRQDAMNDDLKFARVRIRKELIPFLQTFNPKIVETLAKTSILLGEEAEVLAVQNNDIEEVLSLKKMREMPKAERLRYLRIWLKMRRGDLRRIEFKHLEAIEKLILSEKSGRFIELPGNGKITKSCGKLSFELNIVEKRRLAN